eukprot:745796-Hanusia_phi.AAC.2
MGLRSILENLQTASASLASLRALYCQDEQYTSQNSLSSFEDALENLLVCVELGLQKSVTDGIELAGRHQEIKSMEQRIHRLEQDYDVCKHMMSHLLKDANRARKDLDELISGVHEWEHCEHHAVSRDESFVSSNRTLRRIERVCSKDNIMGDDGSDCSDCTFSSHLDELADILDAQTVRR